MLDAQTKNFTSAIAEQRNIFEETTKMQLDDIEELHQVTRTTIKDSNGQLQSVFLAASKENAEAHVAEHQETRRQLNDSIVLEAATLKSEIKNMGEIINEIRASMQQQTYRDTSAQMDANALSTAISAKDIRLSELVASDKQS